MEMRKKLGDGIANLTPTWHGSHVIVVEDTILGYKPSSRPGAGSKFARRTRGVRRH